MEAFNFSNYSTTYLAKCNDFTLNESNQACFSALFRKINFGAFNCESIHYEIFLNTDKRFVENQSRNNYCFLTKHELYNHVKLLKQLMKVTFKIKEVDNGFSVVADVFGNGCTQKYFVSWIRYAYEYPYNAFCLDVNALRQVPGFQFLSKINLFSLASRCGVDFRECHSFVSSETPFEFKSNDFIKNKLEKNPWQLESILWTDNVRVRNHDIDTLDINTLDRNAIESSFKKRIQIYKDILSEYECLCSRSC